MTGPFTSPQAGAFKFICLSSIKAGNENYMQEDWEESIKEIPIFEAHHKSISESSIINA